MLLTEVLSETVKLIIQPVLLVLILYAISERIERKCGVEGYSIVFLLGAGTLYILRPVLCFLLASV
jgi:hypothetical protein